MLISAATPAVPARLIEDRDGWSLACCGGYFSEHLETCPMRARYVTAHGERRERAVPCDRCLRPTWALDRFCDACWQARACRDVIDTESAANTGA